MSDVGRTGERRRKDCVMVKKPGPSDEDRIPGRLLRPEPMKSLRSGRSEHVYRLLRKESWRSIRKIISERS